MMRKLTVLTATYNRCETLKRAYESLCRQNSSDFIWSIIDDGSADNTRTQVEQWKQENKIPIEYHYKENGGVTLARHIGRMLVKTDWMTVLDSDDYLLDGALREIIDLLDSTGVGNEERCIGFAFPAVNEVTSDLVEGNYSLTQQYCKHGCVGEYQLVVKTDVWNRFQPPHFLGEKFITESVYLRQIDRFCYYRCVNRRFMVREYQADGLTQNLAEVIQKSPRGHAYAMKIDCAFGKDLDFSKRVQLYNDFINFSQNRLQAKEELFPEIRVPCAIRCLAALERKNTWLRCARGVAQYPFPKRQIPKHAKIVLWGAGNMGKAWKIYLDRSGYCQVRLWCDTSYVIKQGEGLEVSSPEALWTLQNDYDAILLAIQSPTACAEVEKQLLENGVDPKKIVRMS